MLEEKDRIGLIAGSGELPLNVVNCCMKRNIEIYCVLLDSFANEDDYQNLPYIKSGFGSVGKILKYFKSNLVTKIVFAGAVRKPSLKYLKIDFKGFSLLRRLLKIKMLGDDNILKEVINFLEKEGFEVLEVDEIVNDMKLSEGLNSSVKFNDKGYLEDIDVGRSILEKISDLDIAQSIAIQQKMVIGIECIEGTKRLIERCSELKYTNGRKPILVKIKKLNQTRKADLPTIGPDTIEQLHNSGFAGIALDSKNCIVISPDKTIKLANEYGLFIYGF